MKSDFLFLTSRFTDIRINLALEDQLFKNYKQLHSIYNVVENPKIIFLWRNTPSIIIGRNQNAYTECNIEAIKRDRVKLVRRLTGGGAVYQDLGNTCFTFLSHSNSYNVENNNRFIIESLESFGIKGESSGRNDMIVNGKKFSGSAFKTLNDINLHHGTLLFDVNITNMLKYLTPDLSKLQKHGVKSVESRTVNLSTLNPNLNHESFLDIMLNKVKSFNPDVHELVDEPESDFYTKIKNDEWNYGQQKEYQLTFKNRFDWGLLEINLSMDSGKVTGGRVYSDSLDLEFIQEIQGLLDNAKLKSDRGFPQWDEVEAWLGEVKSPFRLSNFI